VDRAGAADGRGVHRRAVPGDGSVAAVGARPGAAPTAVTLDRDRGTAWVTLGRAGGVGLDGHTGELQGTRAPAVRAAFQKVEELHRWLLLPGDGRQVGQRIVGAPTLLFLLLGLTGPFLWIPRRWTVRLDPQGGRRPAAVQLMVREANASPRFATVFQLRADPFTGQILREERWTELSAGRKARSWMRFLHTGEALDAGGQLAAGLASLGAAVLVWTGLALALRRLARSWRARATLGSRAEPSST